MPAASSDLADDEALERRASDLRATLSQLADKEAPPKALALEINARLEEIDSQLELMKQALVERFDSIPFVSLRAAIPRAVESHRREVIALLEVLLGDRDELLERLPRVEYVITMLATEEDEGHRNIVHDPVTLTPLLENLVFAELESSKAESIAMELYQAAMLDSDSEVFHQVLRSLRARKNSIGLGCLSPVVLRAVVTYNARMFNSVESLAEASRASDALLDTRMLMVDGPIDPPAEAVVDEFIDDTIVDELDPAEDGIIEVAKEDDPAPQSVFESEALDKVLDALRIRLQGAPVGRRGPEERISVILDQSSLEPLESEAILAESRTEDQDIVARTTVVGLMLRDLGSLQPSLAELGVLQTQLADDWVRELNTSFGQLISGMVADPKAYEKSSQLSGIKTKHLLKPLKSLNTANRGVSGDVLGVDGASAVMLEADRVGVARSGGGRSRHSARTAISMGSWLGEGRLKSIAAAALVTIALGLVLANVIEIIPTDVRTVKPESLRITSPYLQSAYRNENGRGGLMIGKVDALFVELPIERKIDAANEMAENFEFQGIREAMFYDDRGMMQVHYVAGRLHRPRPGDRSTGHAPGESAVRRTLTGEKLEEVKADAGTREAIDDPWSDF